MTIKFSPSQHLSSRTAFQRHYENQQKDREWDNDIKEYGRILDREKLYASLHHHSEAVLSMIKRDEERKATLEAKWPQLKKIF